MEIKVKNALPNNLVDGGIFRYMPLYGNMTQLQMGTLYMAHSGEKRASSLLRLYLDEDGKLPQDKYQMVGHILTNIYKDNWDKKYQVLHIEYNPLENYSMTESGTDENTGNDVTTNINGEKNITDTYGQDKITNVMGEKKSSDEFGEIMNTNENQVSAFNSTSYQDNDKTVDIQGDHTNNHTENSYTDTTTKDSKVDTHKENSYTDTSTLQHGLKTEHSFERKGNIGVTTSQQMATSELELREYDFFENMFKDIDSYLALNVY